MLNYLPNDLIQYILSFLDPYLIHDVKYINEKITSLEMHFLKQINHTLNKNVELYYKNKLKTVFVINDVITNHYNNVIKTLYYNEIAKIGNIKMFGNFENFNVIEKNNNVINNACLNGHIHILEWFKNTDFEFKYDNGAIYYASGNGHIHILEWFKNSGFEFKYDEYAINNASENGHRHILEWFKNYKLVI
jgi:hypothetical protein